MNNIEIIECPATSSLTFVELDKAAFTSRARAERFIDTYCVECPNMVKCGEQRPADAPGTWGGVFYG
jgi:hypothetical protein